MRKYTPLFLLAVVAMARAAAANLQIDLAGRWTVVGTAGAQETTALSSDDVDRLSGTDFVVTPESVQFSGEKCDKPTFRRSRHRTAEFFRRAYKLDPGSMRLPDTVTEISINCLTPSPISFVYIRDRQHIVLYWRGYFLNVEKREGHSP
jgi:hypothetical protein